MSNFVLFRGMLEEEELKLFVEEFTEAQERSPTEMIDVYFSTNGGKLYTIPVWIDFIRNNIDYISRFIMIESCDSLGINLFNYLYKNHNSKLFLADTFIGMTCHKTSLIADINKDNNIDFTLFDSTCKKILSKYFKENPEKEKLFDGKCDINLSRYDVMNNFINLQTISYINE